MDTAQLSGAAETDPNAQLANAADAFKAFTVGEPVVQPRDTSGRFASETVDEGADEPEVDETGGEAEPDDVIDEDDEEAAVEAQPLPTSWPADKADEWASLPAETQAFLAERDAEQTRAVNAKFQEAANARKAADAEYAQVQANRAQYAEALETLMAAVQPVEPDPRHYGAGTGQYDRESYDLAMLQYREQSQVYAQLSQQRDLQRQTEAQEDAARFNEWKQGHEAQYAPKFIADVPELNDPVRAPALLRSVVDYALEHGIPETAFSDAERVTSAELHILWKAQQYDKLKSAPPAAKPAPKAGPAVKPGVSSPRSAQKSAQRTRDFDRLAKSGSVEDGAAIFKHYLR